MSIKDFIRITAETEQDNIRDIRITAKERKGDVKTIIEKIDPVFEKRALDFMEKLLDEGAYESNAARGLAGLDSEKAWEIRERLLRAGVDKCPVAEGLAGLNSEKAWEIRERLLLDPNGDNGDIRSSVAIGLAGLDSEKAWKMRERLLNQEDADKRSVAEGLAGLDSEKAWEMRERLLLDPNGDNGNIRSSVAIGLAGLDSEKAWEMRERLLKQGVDIEYLTRGLASLDSEKAWEMRERLLNKDADNTIWLDLGLAGLDSEKAWEMRERLLHEGMKKSNLTGSLGLLGTRAQLFHENNKKVHFSRLVAIGLAGLDSEKAWEMRERLLREGADKDWVARGITGDYITFVWRIRHEVVEDFREEREPMPVRRKF